MAMKLPLAVQIQSLGLPAPVQEHRFHTERGWMFDLAWPDLGQKIAVEIEGGTWKPGGGRHNRAKGYEEDCRKYNAAAELGWVVYRYTTRQVANGEALTQIERVLRRAIDGDLSDS